MTDKQKWLNREIEKVHESIMNNEDMWLRKVEHQYNRVFNILIREMEKDIKSYEKGNVSRERFIERYRILAGQARDRAIEIGTNFSSQMPEKLAQYANYSHEHVGKLLRRVTAMTALPAHAIELASGFNYKDYNFQSSMHRSGIKLGMKLNNILTEGLAKGWDIRKYSKELQKATDFTVYESNRIARSETARVSSEGSKKAMRQYGMERVEWNAALEKRTCERCSALHGKKYPIDNAPPLPLHPNCRCVLLPVIDGWS